MSRRSTTRGRPAKASSVPSENALFYMKRAITEQRHSDGTRRASERAPEPRVAKRDVEATLRHDRDHVGELPTSVLQAWVEVDTLYRTHAPAFDTAIAAICVALHPRFSGHGAKHPKRDRSTAAPSSQPAPPSQPDRKRRRHVESVVVLPPSSPPLMLNDDDDDDENSNSVSF